MKRTDSRLVAILYTTILFTTVCNKGADASYGCLTADLKNGVATLQSYGRKATFKCDQGFQLFGSANSACVGDEWVPPAPICVKAGCGAIPVIRNGVIYREIVNASVVQFRCNPGYYSSEFPAVYCNGSHWNITKLECKEDSRTSQMRCDFEAADLCGWTQRDFNNDTYKWQRHSGSTPSRILGTGPLFDHSFGPERMGHYMYIEGSNGHTDDKAYLYSPVYGSSLYRDSCVYFWYHMFGATTGSLNVYIKPEEVELEHLEPRFQREGHQEDAWLLGSFHLNDTGKPFQIVFEGVHGHGYTSDIAIDDVTLVNGSCAAQLTTKRFGKGRRQAQRTTAPPETAGAGGPAVAAVVLAAAGVLLATAAAALLAWRWRRRLCGGGGSPWQAAPDGEYVRYMSQQEALVLEHPDAADDPLAAM